MNQETKPMQEEKKYSTAEFVKNFMNDHNGGTPRWLRSAFFDEKEKIETILEYMSGIESLSYAQGRADIIKEIEGRKVNEDMRINYIEKPLFSTLKGRQAYNQALQEIKQAIKNKKTNETLNI